MAMSAPRRLAAVFIGLAAVPALGGVQPFDFVIRPQSSSIDAVSVFSVQNTGTFVGSFDAATSPGGTRTRPGADDADPFGPTDNLPVPLYLAGELGDRLTPAVSGGFRLDLNAAGGTVQISGFSSSLLASGSITLPASVYFLTDGFRTRAPAATYAGGQPLSLPINSATITTLAAAQAGGPVTGTLTPGAGPGQYDFTVAPLVELATSLTYLGSQYTALSQAPIALALGGTITVTGDTALLTSFGPMDLASQSMPGSPLPRFAFDLPTFNPPGDTAHLLLDMTVDDVTAGLSGTLSLTAAGTLVPVPGTGAAAGVLAALALRRRRR